ncbi:MAG: hypothetical protein CVV47_11975 [Spirochaetae bacterium HGW-Spirochaetae-3]|nr:MAG: hypothetical protein CVV47_11975 [Spirochaetae bacterium HGW-Spirochaetae-3]
MSLQDKRRVPEPRIIRSIDCVIDGPYDARGDGRAIPSAVNETTESAEAICPALKVPFFGV